MTTTATRVLRLLSLLQSRREWTGSSLSERLEVDVRTVRRDANRLRELGYVIESTAGPGGGYRLSAGTSTPPLLLDDAEAITVALALGTAASTMGNFAQSALGVLVKLDQLLPTRLRRKWHTIINVTLSLSDGSPALDTKLLATLAAACRDERRITFKYSDRNQQQTLRVVEPMRLVHAGRVWYLAAWDTQRDDWRTFRLDRIDTATAVRIGPPFVPRQPGEDFAALVSRAISHAHHVHNAELLLRMPLAEAKRRVPPWVGVLTADGSERCILTLRASTQDALMALFVHAGIEFELIAPGELADVLHATAHRLFNGAPRRGQHRAVHPKALRDK